MRGGARSLHRLPVPLLRLTPLVPGLPGGLSSSTAYAGAPRSRCSCSPRSRRRSRPRRPVAVFQRRRDYADRSIVLAHARADASTALTDTLDAAQAAVADLEARSSVTRTALAQTQVAAALTRARLLVALSNLRSQEAAAQAVDAYNAEVARRQIASRRLANRAALEAQWALERATVAAAADQRIQSMYGGFQIPDGLGGN